MGPKKKAAAKEPEQQFLPLEMQQIMLNHFRKAFVFESIDALQVVVQEVKGHLYNRDFSAAFGSQAYREAYAYRWSASRALAYADIFSQPELRLTLQKVAHGMQSASRVVCIGGGAGAEVIALAAALHDSPVEVAALDIADWKTVLDKLNNCLTTPLSLSKYASEDIRMANKSLVDPSHFHLGFLQQDILDYKDEALKGLVTATGLCTIMFTLNELFTSSISKTTAFLLRLTDAMELGSCLLVVDSPGSYSEVSMGKDGKSKQYPMKWLLDHALLQVAQGKWEKILEDDSRWFRVDAKLEYPIDLENMRYQIHLYKRLEK